MDTMEDEGELTTERTEGVQAKEALSPLPFTYKPTENPEQASYREWRVSPVVFEGEENQPQADEEIVESVRKQHEAKQWYTQEYWRKKGQPVEQIEFEVDGRQITVYNFNKEIPFTNDYIQKTETVFRQLASHFPKILDQVRWVLIDDVQPPSLLADDERYPTNGTAMREHQAFRFMPRGMGLEPHRVESASNFEGTFVHEMGHLIQDELEDEWREKYSWQYCLDDKDKWEVRKAPNGENRWFSKDTGEMAPQGQYPLQPDQCINYYAKQNMGEDICESLVAYIYDPEKLADVALDKRDIFRSHDAQEKEPKISTHRISKKEIKLPEVNPETVFYYIEEPEEKKV